MKLKQWGKRLLALFLLLTILTGLLPTGLLQAEANELPSEKPSETRIAGTVSSWDNDGDGTLSILAIGNSFSSDAMEYFYQIANDLGISKMYLGNLYIGGCTLATHLSNANNDSASYTYYKNTSGSWSSTSNVKMSTALTERSWDFVTLQQASPNSGQANTYGSNLTNLIAYVKSKLKNPEATKLAWHMTWAYQANSTHSGFANYSNNQTTMYNKIIEAVNSQVVPNKDIEVIIPTGTAIQNLRSSILGDKLTRDGYHLSYGVGRYTAALMWVKELTGLDINAVTWKSTSTALSANGEEKFLAIEAVNFAYKTPLAKTNSHYVNNSDGTPKLDPAWGFVQISPGNHKYEYWHSTGDYHTNRATEDTAPKNAKQYISTNKLSKTGTTGYNNYLPVGSIIVCYANYRYRPEGWVVDNKKQTGTRPVEVDDTYVIVTEEWWGSFTKRAFNISKDDDSDWTSGFSAGDVNHYFRIYIPIERVLEHYYQLDLVYTKDQYWNSNKTHQMQSTTTANAGKFFGAQLPASVTTYNPATGENETTKFDDRRITKDMLPVDKGLISIRTGYKVRQEGWINGNTLNNTDANPRPSETHHNLHSTSSGWWDDYTLRGFNISYDGEGADNTSNNSQSTMESYILRVYILRSEYPCAIQLEKELEIAEKYLRWNNRLGQFPADLYAEFKKCVTDSKKLFRENNNGIRFVVPCTGTTKTKVENARNYQAQKLKNIIDKLAYYEVTDDFSNYIDLPIEVLDFRADGILFDNYNSGNPYSLSSGSPGITNALTGASLPRAGSDFTTSDGTVVEHLTLPELVDGQLIYREETVTFIAHGIAQKLYAFGDTAHTPTDFKASYYGANWNSAFMNKITAGFGTTDMTTRLGSWSDTLKKVGLNQGLDGTVEGTNGGILKYTQVTTAFDLAYYMLNNIWRSVGESDPLVDESGTVLKRPDGKPLTYNTVVKELTSIRLIRGSNGYYSFTSESDVGRDPISGTLFNTINPKLSFSPKLNAVGELGFEKPGIYNPTTTGIVNGRSVTTTNATSNYDYMIHANGVFVYHKGKNLEFTFKGDDDVYFYINGSIACDVGGMHSATTRTCTLNDIADRLGLVDGDVCTFDMFLVDRHTSEINLNFSTNIDLMASQAVTTEPQTDHKTGAIISNNAIVADGTDVGFAFNLLNQSDYPVANLSFRNDKLDAYLSAESLTLGDFVDGNTLEDKVANLTITYTAYDPATKAYTNATPQVMSATEFDDLYSIIEGGCNSVSTIPLSEQAYTITGLTADQLMSLLELGLPCNVRISISGFHHIVYASVGTYTNEVTTVCYPVLKDGSIGAGLLGVASTSVQAKIMESKVHDPLQIVLDYGKPVEFKYSDIMSHVILAEGATASYIGMNRQGSHGQISDYKPSGMLLTSEGSTYASDNGIYDYHGNVFRFTLTRMLEEVEKINAVLEIHENGVSTTWYLMVAIEIVPATMVYYEAESFTDSISLMKKTSITETVDGKAQITGIERQTQWTEKGDDANGSSPDYLQDSKLTEVHSSYYSDYVGDEEVLFFGFENRPEDRLRYQSPVYGGVNFDDPAAVEDHWFVQHWHKVDKRQIDNQEGVLRLIGKPLPGQEESRVNQYPDMYFDTYSSTAANNTPLNYNPQHAEILQVRFKLKDLVIGTHYPKNSDGSFIYNPDFVETVYPYLTLQFKGNGVNSLVNAKFLTKSDIHTDLFNNEVYMTMRLRINPNNTVSNNVTTLSFRNYDSINSLRVFFGGMESAERSGENDPNWKPGILTVDYVYIGPEHKAPVDSAYGRDYSYDNDNKLSNGKSLYVEGNGIWNLNSNNERDPKSEPDNYTEGGFTFTGTGFDIIGRTGPNGGSLRVEIYEDHNRLTPIKTLTVQQKGETELYQIPVVSVQDLAHGTYYVSVMVNNVINSSFEFLRRGNEFYLDALRIYDPIDVSHEPDPNSRGDAAIAYRAYCNDAEAHPIIKEVRDILLSAKDFHALNGEAPGAVFLDYTVTQEGDTTGSRITSAIETYNKVGPKNEVYLGPNQAIAFIMKVSSEQLPDRVDIGCKTVDGSSGILRVNLAASANDSYHPFEHTVTSGTAQYYSVPMWKERFREIRDSSGQVIGHSIYVVIQNIAGKNNSDASQKLLSITDIKVAFKEKPTALASNQVSPAQVANGEERVLRGSHVELPEDSFEPISFVVEGNTAELVEALLEEQYRPSHDHSPGPWHKVCEASPECPETYICYCEECGQPVAERYGAENVALAFAGASVSLQSDLAINYKVNRELLETNGFTQPYVVIEDNGTTVTLREYSLQDGKYVFVYRNIAPHRIGDMVTATLYASYGGKLYRSESRDYSVADYCYNMLGKTEGMESYESLRRLLVDILLYGAKTQEYMSYRCESLCSERLSPSQLACGTESCRELENHRNQSYETVENPTVYWKGAGLNLRESVAIRFRIEAESYEGLEVRITLAGKTYRIYSKDFDHRQEGTYVYFRSINAAQMSEPVYAAVFHNGVQVSDTVCYSIESYAYSKQNDTIPHLAELVKRMMCYGDSTRAYVLSTQ